MFGWSWDGQLWLPLEATALISLARGLPLAAEIASVVETVRSHSHGNPTHFYFERAYAALLIGCTLLTCWLVFWVDTSGIGRPVKEYS